MSGRPSSCSVRRGSNPSQTNHIQFLLDASPLLSAYVDAQERHCCCNHAYAACFGLTLEEVVGRSVQEVVGAEAYRSLEGGIRETLAGQRQEWEAVVPSPQIGARVVAITCVPDVTEAGTVQGFAICLLDITERRRAEAELERRVQEQTEQFTSTIAQAEQSILALNASLEERVKERTIQLQAALKELEAFSYSVSHDLRAPLRAINGFGRILLEDYAPQLEPEAQSYIKRMCDNAVQMGRLVDDLLAFSRLGRQEMKLQTVRVEELVRQILCDLQSDWGDHQVALRIGHLPMCRGDASLLRQVWINLLSNALKFTRNRPIAEIEIGSFREAGPEGPAVYFVRDNGVGFDMRYAHKLFGVFQRLHRMEDFEGTGVGLAIVHRILHRHGGRVWAESTVDRGATFYFTLQESKPA